LSSSARVRKKTSEGSSITPTSANFSPRRSAQRPAQGEVPRLLLAEPGVPLRHLQKRVEPNEKPGPVSEDGAARLFGCFSLSHDLAPIVTLIELLARDGQPAEGGMVPVDALHGVRWCSCLQAGQATQ